jgi:hypothetical protein
MNKTFTFHLILLISTLFSINGIAQNSTCSNALTIQPGTFTIDTLQGTGAIFQGATAAAWYHYTPTEEGKFSISSCNGKADTRLVVLLLEDCVGQTDLQIINSVEDNCEDGLGTNKASFAEVTAIPGITYVIYWDNGQSSKGFSWNLVFSASQNDKKGTLCVNADTIGVGTHQIDSLSGTGSAFLDAVSARWYAFKPEKDGDLAINSCQSGINTRLFVWKGNCPTLQKIAQDDNSCPESDAALLEKVAIQKDSLYYIYWDDHHSNEGFEFNLSVENPSIVSVEEPLWAKEIGIFPNPANHTLSIAYHFPKKMDLHFSILNQLGQELVHQNWTSFQNGRVNIATQSLANGFYFVKIGTPKAYIIRKIRVQHY